MYPQVFGKYVLERELARGGMARVVLATLRGAGGFEKKLVVKQIRDELACDDEFVRRFVLEANTTVKLAHPNIVPVYELGVELGTYFLAMEFVEGASLAELLRASSSAAADAARPRLSPEEAAYVGVEVCRALDYAHRRMNVVHRDVTPRNVMVDEEGQIKVIDFGIAAPVATAPSGHGVFGSPGHMPPEQMEAKELTPAADVFAVAVLLMELWSGKAPFRRRTREEIEAAMRAPHPRPSDADIRLLPLDDVMASAMTLDPAARPQQADDLGRALRRFLAGIDLGDLARHLGDRVRNLRIQPAPPVTEPRPVLQRPPSRPTATQVGTKTFAAREDGPVRVPVADPIPESSTRRIESRAPAGAPDAPEGLERPSAHATVASALETDAQADARVRRGLVVQGIVGATALAIAAFFLGRIATTTPRTDTFTQGGVQQSGVVQTSATPGPGAQAPASAFATTATAATSIIPPATATAPAPVGSAGAGETRAVLAATARGAVEPGARDLPGSPGREPSSPNGHEATAASRAQLTLVGDGALVAVDGVARGACPARVALEAGPHTVVFSFPPTGESKAETLTLRVGDRTTLHADFTGAAPSIRVQRM
jgi:serine/threonine-protein kinase